MNGQSAFRTRTSWLSIRGNRSPSIGGRSSRASWRRWLLAFRTSAYPAPECPRSTAWVVAGLAFVIAAAGSHATDAGEPECVREAVEWESRKIRLKKDDGTSRRVDSADLPGNICVLERITNLPQYRIRILPGSVKGDPSLEGEWLVKRRNVQIKGGVNVDCPDSKIFANVEIRKERVGGVRAIGEEPCN